MLLDDKEELERKAKQQLAWRIRSTDHCIRTVTVVSLECAGLQTYKEQEDWLQMILPANEYRNEQRWIYDVNAKRWVYPTEV